MIKPKVIEVPEWEVYEPSGERIGYMNIYEFNDLRIQISKERAEGYYVMFNDVKINIKPDGTTDRWPNGFFDQIETQLRELIRLRLPQTSAYWQEHYPQPRVLDPDGWDRQNYEYSWFQENITYQEYQRRLSLSTCLNYKENP